MNILTEDFIIFKNFDALIIDEVSNRVIAKSKLDSGNIDVKVEAKEIRAGKENSIIATIGGNRDITLKMEEPVFNLETLAMQVGQDVIDEGAGIAYAMSKVYDVGIGLAITLDEVPIDGTFVFENPGITATITADSKIITIAGSGIAAGDEIRILTYQYATSASTQTININAGTFAGAKRVVMENDVYDLSENKVGKIQYEFSKAKPVGNFNIDVKGGDASKNSMEFKVLAHNGKLGKAMFIPVSSASSYASVVGENVFVSKKTITGKK